MRKTNQSKRRINGGKAAKIEEKGFGKWESLDKKLMLDIFNRLEPAFLLTTVAWVCRSWGRACYDRFFAEKGEQNTLNLRAPSIACPSGIFELISRNCFVVSWMSMHVTMMMMMMTTTMIMKMVVLGLGLPQLPKSCFHRSLLQSPMITLSMLQKGCVISKKGITCTTHDRQIQALVNNKKANS